MQTKKESKTNPAFAGLANIPFYPINYAKVLIQIGYEPLAPFKSTSIFGKEQFFYPNTFAYLKYIHHVEGFTGLYRGLGMRIISNVIGNHVQSAAYKWFEEQDKKTQETEVDLNESNFSRLIRQSSKEITSKCWAVVISHPFHVMAIRCMAQFIGGETKYSSWNFVQNSIVIYKGEGVSGFFSGLIPRLLFEASTIAVTNLIAYLIKTYIFDEKEMEIFVDLFSSMLSTSITYPLSVVSTVSTVAGSGLVAGQPPRMPYYASWIEVFQSLYESNQFKRGSSYFFRVYNPTPIISKNVQYSAKL